MPGLRLTTGTKFIPSQEDLINISPLKIKKTSLPKSKKPKLDKMIKKISEKQEGIVFLLWGNFARKKKELIDTSKHHVLESPHPSPLARGFLGCKHFSQCNALLEQQGKETINWQV